MTEATPAPPADTTGYEMTRFNALRHGVLSRYTVLPWEDHDEYCRLLDALVAEHRPKGPTEEHLVEEMVGILWRKRRLRLAEAAAYRRGLKSAVFQDRQTIEAALVHLDIEKQTAANTAMELAELVRREAVTACALDLLQAGKARAYDKALGALSERTREWWKELIKPKPELGLLLFSQEENRYTANAHGLFQFLQGEVMRSYEARRKELQNRQAIREQVFGEGVEIAKLDGLARYETHLDRKLERMLTMLIRLQDLRRVTAVNAE